MKIEEVQSGLLEHRTSTAWYRDQSGIVYSSGMKWLADSCGLHSLISTIGAYQSSSRIQDNPELRDFQMWEIFLNEDMSAVMYCLIANDIEPIIEHSLPRLDIPMDELHLQVINGALMLPTEQI